tara:strand:+ start:1762 stop:4674 length:2913 start_codon:yes stop_codon:yes gene_type:complete
MELRENQLCALEKNIINNYNSGVHFHATGTGKSWIALELILSFNKKYSNKNILWLCEQKSILIEQFKRETIIKKGYEAIFKQFNIFNFALEKPKCWYKKLKKNEKPLLIIINRSFLVSLKKYEKIKINIDLIIHDECHTIKNKTTRQFYDYILNKHKNLSCIGFSATPNLKYKPFNKIISSYTIYNAFCDNIILPPLIKWVKSDKILDNNDIIKLCKFLIKNLYYKKIIIWCGMIDLCFKLANLWKKEFKNFLVSIDTSLNNNNCEYSDFDTFNKSLKNAILFCACKHREGSDIKNLDCCIFLDKVEKRNPKTFVQCIGRVLRKDEHNKKKYGLILDLKASSCIKICDRMNSYLNCKNFFPWKYKYFNKTINGKKITINKLKLIKYNENKIIKKKEKEFTIKQLKKKFIIECPDNKIYKKRLKKELKIINKKKLSTFLIRAIKILKLVDYIPHVTRGSCGSSLVCYLLGISNVDPIKNDIKFERFLNEYRDNLPDIDLDFPHYLRDEVFLKLELNWPNQVARISNHVHWHEKSALREAIRRIGIRKQIPKETINKFVNSLSKEEKSKIIKIKKELINTFRHYSLHCGGIVFFNSGVPDNIILKNGNGKTLSQIIYDKRDVSKNNNFKIDILSSRGISQLINIVGKKSIDFKNCPYDEKTYKLLQSGDNIGITLAESPLMRKALINIKPKSIKDLAVCLAIIRPAAKDARIKINEIDYNTKFVFDDDAITILSENLNITYDLADKFRRCISKNSWKKNLKKKYEDLLNKLSSKKKNKIINELDKLRKYSFCKSHSYSYAQLVYKLAYQKAHNTKKFWESTIKNVNSSYRKWVHLYEAKISGVDVMKIIQKKNKSIYAENRKKKFNNLSKKEQLTRFGYWNMTNDSFFDNCYFYSKNNIYYFGGLIASLRILSFNKKKTKIICSLCVGPKKYIELNIDCKYYNKKSYAIKGRAKIINVKNKSFKAIFSTFLK